MPASNMTSFSDKIAVITGGSSGVGEAIGQALAERGAQLHLIGRRLPPLLRSARARNRHFTSHRVDLEDEGEIAACVTDIGKSCERVDILIHSAGIIKIARVEEARIEDFDRQYRVNVRAAYLLTQGLLPLLKVCEGQVVFINSSVGQTARASVGQYSATKHALVAVANSFREECNPHGIRVMSVYLGRTATPMQADIHKAEGKEYCPDRLLQPRDIASVVLKALNLPRTAEVTEIHIRPMKKPA
jgi:NADP-dependent 3-hydroxy acid dehydrogenase YdfG